MADYLLSLALATHVLTCSAMTAGFDQCPSILVIVLPGHPTRYSRLLLHGSWSDRLVSDRQLVQVPAKT